MQTFSCQISDTTVLTLWSRTACQPWGSSFSFSACNVVKVTSEDYSFYYLFITQILFFISAAFAGRTASQSSYCTAPIHNNFYFTENTSYSELELF